MKKKFSFLLVLAVLVMGLSACGSSKSDTTSETKATKAPKATETAESKKELEKQALWLCQHEDKQIILKGYTDPRGTQAYNLKLGERRAQAVKDFLISEGVAANRITVVSYGKKDPASSMNDPAGWAKDRRAVTVAITD